METIDLITLRAKRELAAFTRETRQSTKVELLDLEPLRQFNSIEIDEEHITIRFNEKTVRAYNFNETTQKEWQYKYNDDPEFVAAIKRVVELAREHLRDLPNNVACPPGCAGCCMAYEPFVSEEDVKRIAQHLGLSYKETMKRYVNARPSPDGHSVGWLKKVDNEDVKSKCVFLMGKKSGEYYCGIYSARPHDCREFSPIDCEDVDTSLRHDREFKVGPPFRARSNGRG
ncbi:MAG: YkgJ family cysteine cluster protein [Candidatus Eremiobacteraeota bacterium]|nr:YkgJ family cysteine cluster protein [Candidatus Eremiobacteraeota bacterium]MBV8332107.1 YkgJ family cysteine cluster protein [Candidatus Eremiobacteraeota bacterium]